MARILIVDDEANIRMMVKLALEHVGYSTGSAADGPDGLAKFGSGQDWDLVLLDQRMPGKSGLEVLREILRRDPDARIIMITAFGTVDLAVEAMKCGARDFLRKPFTADVLRGAVQAALQERVDAGVPVADGAITYAITTLNGFHIESHPGAGIRREGERRFVFTIRAPDGSVTETRVQIPAYVTELIKAQTDREQMPGGERFWQALSESVLANYVWQNAGPPEELLVVEEVTPSIRRWVDSVLAGAG